MYGSGSKPSLIWHWVLILPESLALSGTLSWPVHVIKPNTLVYDQILYTSWWQSHEPQLFFLLIAYKENVSMIPAKHQHVQWRAQTFWRAGAPSSTCSRGHFRHVHMLYTWVYHVLMSQESSLVCFANQEGTLAHIFQQLGHGGIILITPLNTVIVRMLV